MCGSVHSVVCVVYVYAHVLVLGVVGWGLELSRVPAVSSWRFSAACARCVLLGSILSGWGPLLRQPQETNIVRTGRQPLRPAKVTRNNCRVSLKGG